MDWLEQAIERDLRDSARLKQFAAIVTTALDAVASDPHDLEHPDARWHPYDLVETLQGELRSIKHEQRRLRGAVVE